jgi:hypothetical protein
MTLSQRVTRVEGSQLRARVLRRLTPQGLVEPAPRKERPRRSDCGRLTPYANSQDVPLGANALDHATRFVASDGARCVLMESGFREHANSAPRAPIRCPARRNGPFTVIPGVREIGFGTVGGVVAEMKTFDRMICRKMSCVKRAESRNVPARSYLGFTVIPGAKLKPCF